MAALHRPRRRVVATALSLFGLGANLACASTETPPAGESSSISMPPVDDDESAGAPILAFEVTSASGERDYLLVRPPPTYPNDGALPAAFLAAIENAEAANVVERSASPGVAAVLSQLRLADGKTLKDVLAPETYAAFKAWTDAKGFGPRAALLENLHPAAVGATAWLLEDQVRAGAVALDLEDRLRQSLRRIPAPLESTAASVDVLERVAALSTTLGEDVMRRALDENARARAWELEAAVNAAWARADLVALEAGWEALVREHPLYMVGHAIDDRAPAECAGIAANGSADALLVDAPGLRGPSGCLASLVGAGASLRQLREKSAVSTVRVDGLVVDNVRIRDADVKKLPLAIRDVKAKKRLRLPADAEGRTYSDAVRDSAFAILELPTGKKGPDALKAGGRTLVVYDLDRERTGTTFRANALRGRVTHAGREYAFAIPPTGDALTVVDLEGGEVRNLPVRASDGRSLQLLATYMLDDGTLLVTAMEGHNDPGPKKTIINFGPPGPMFFAHVAPTASEVRFDKEAALLIADGYSGGVAVDGQTVTLGPNEGGVLVAPSPDAICASGEWSPASGPRCLRWWGEGQQWMATLNGRLLEVDTRGRGELTGVRLDDGALVPTPGCGRSVLNQPGGHTFALGCKDSVRIFGGDKERTLNVPERLDDDRVSRKLRDIGPDRYLVVPPSVDAAPLVVDGQTGDALSVRFGSAELTPWLEAYALVADRDTGALAVLEHATGTLHHLEGAACGNQGLVPQLADATPSRFIVACRARLSFGPNKQTGVVYVVDRKSGKTARLPGGVFAVTPSRLVLEEFGEKKDGTRTFALPWVELKSLPGFAGAE